MGFSRKRYSILGGFLAIWLVFAAGGSATAVAEASVRASGPALDGTSLTSGVSPILHGIELPAKTDTRVSSGVVAERYQVVITEEDVKLAVSGLDRDGPRVRGLDVQFRDGKISLRADSVSYGLLKVRNLRFVGRLMASNGRLRLTTDKMSPGGLTGAIIVRAANEALARYASPWYVEGLRSEDGRLTLTIRS